MSELPTQTDVLVVGAGPAGLAVSTVLTARGVSHLTVDRAPLGSNTSRAAVVHARTLEVLDEIGVTGTLLERGVVVPTFTVRDGERTLATLDFSGLPTRFPYTLMVPQDVTERVLADRLAELGGELTAGWRLISLDLDSNPGRALATLADDDGATRIVDARYVIGADGMHSTVREHARIAFDGAAYPETFVLADVRMDWPLPEREVQLFFSPDGLVVVAPLPGGRHRVVATVGTGATAGARPGATAPASRGATAPASPGATGDQVPEHPDLDYIAELVHGRGPAGARVHEVVWSSRFRVHHRLAATYRRGPVFLAGDAAHVHSPAGGQGMNTGIQDAVALGGLLADVLADGADPALLDTYETRRRPVAREVVKMTDRMTRAATLRGPAARVRNLALRGITSVPAVRRSIAMNLSELATDTARPAEPTQPAALTAQT